MVVFYNGGYMSDINNISKEFKETALMRLDFWIWINSRPAHSSDAFWNRSVDHRIICMVAVNTSLNQLPDDLSSHRGETNRISYESIRRLCRCTDKTMRSIIQEGVDRGELVKIKSGRETFISGTKKLIAVFENFEGSWLEVVKKNKIH